MFYKDETTTIIIYLPLLLLLVLHIWTTKDRTNKNMQATKTQDTGALNYIVDIQLVEWNTNNDPIFSKCEIVPYDCSAEFISNSCAVVARLKGGVSSDGDKSKFLKDQSPLPKSEEFPIALHKSRIVPLQKV